MKLTVIAALLALLCLATVSASAASPDSKMENMLRQLDPSARIEQVCDMAAMAQIRRDPGRYRPDRALAAALAEPKVGDALIEARGAAFRSGGKWFQLSYVCRTTPDRMQVVSFEYRIGAAIPEDKWDAYGLPR